MILGRRSVRLQLTLWYAAGLTVVVLLFAAGVYALVAWSFHRQGSLLLDDAIKSVQQAFEDGGDELQEIDHHGSVSHFGVASGESVIYQSDGWRHSQLSTALAGLSGGGGDAALQVKAPNGEPFLVRTVVLSEADSPVALSAAISQQLPEQSLSTVAVMLFVGLPIAILGAAVAGYWLAGRALAPVIAITAKARDITAERLDERLPIVNPDDEFGQLATVFNDVLARLGDSFERLRRFTSDASHELRTPLTAIRSVGEVALQNNATAAKYRDAIGSMLEESDRLARLLDSLLTLTRADAGHITVRRERVDVCTIARDVCDLLRTLAEERRQELTVSAATPLHAEADPNLLRQALVNFIDNAIKYTPDGGSIRVGVYLSPSDEVAVEVSDTGPGIAAEHQARIFDRFYRVERARARETGGVGLGLSLAKWAVEVNGGRIELESEPRRGSTFRIVLPGHAALQRSQDPNTTVSQDEGVKR